LSCEAVAAGTADIAAVDVAVWKRLQRDRPRLVDQLTVLTDQFTLPLVPVQPFVASSTLGEADRVALRDALLSLGRTGSVVGAVPEDEDEDEEALGESDADEHKVAADNISVGARVSQAQAMRQLFMSRFVNATPTQFDLLRDELARCSAPVSSGNGCDHDV